MSKNHLRSLVLLSGGMDSTTLLGMAMNDEQVEVDAAVFVDYGQRHLRERESAKAVAEHYGVELIELDLTSFGKSVKSALTSGIEVPHGHYAADNMALTVVPNRNATMLSAVAGIAASRDCVRVLTAVHAGDHAVYADCRPEFIEAMSYALELACGITVMAPFAYSTKADIAKAGAVLKVPYELTWSCYEGNGDLGHCGRCGTCVERAEAFHVAEVPDPTVYQDSEFWREQVGA